MIDELVALDATAQAELVRKKEVSPLELVEAAIERIERLNPQLNAVVTPMYDLARAAAAGPLPEGPFTGVPFLLKDLEASYGGVRMTSGSASLKDYIAPQDSELVARHKRAGFITLGKTNTPEFGLMCTTEPRLFGPARNPWDPTRTPGGSSGGSCVAVASGMVAAAHASDGGGSIRIPASCCGLFGLKPSRGRNPLAVEPSSLSVEHAVTRSVRDSAAILDATQGAQPGDPYHAPLPQRPYVEEVGAPPGRLRIGFTTRGLWHEELHADCVAAARDAAALCEELGHDVEEARPPFPADLILNSFTTIWEAGAAAQIDSAALFTARPVTQDLVEPLTWALAQNGRKRSAPELFLALGALQITSVIAAQFHEAYDLWLTPTLGEPPVPLGTFDDSPPGDPMRAFERAQAFVPFTPVQNATGQPAMSVPLFWNAEGLPIGTHFVARYGEEATLFRLAAQLEEARPWAQRRPPVSA
jgi:amidase